MSLEIDASGSITDENGTQKFSFSKNPLTFENNDDKSILTIGHLDIIF